MLLNRSKKQERRLRRRAEHIPRFALTEIGRGTLCVFPILLSLPGLAHAQSPVTTPNFSTPNLTEKKDVSATALSAKPNETKDNPGKPVVEFLKGGGGQTGYLLRHGNLLTDTVSLALNGRTLVQGKEFTLDSGSGTIYFLVPVAPLDQISVYYRYLDTPQTANSQERTTSLLPMLRFNLGGATQIGFAYNTIADSAKGVNTTTYGFGLNTNFGQNKASSVGGRYYFSSTQANQNLSMALDGSAPTAPGDKKNEGNDHLLTQSLGLNTGKFRFHADYQDVGEKFNGFASLKQGATGASDLAEINALEGEKGVKRLGFGLGIGTGGKKNADDGLTFALNTIQDTKDSISQSSVAYHSQAFQFHYDTRAIGEKFERFSGLREADKAQLQKERGLKMSSLGFGFGFSTAKGATVANGFALSQQSFGDTAGTLSRQAISLRTEKIHLEVIDRRADSKFSRLNDLSTEDKNALALDVRRQFDPNATATQITDADRQQFAKEAGLNRSGLRLDLSPAKTASVSFGQMSVGEKDAQNSQNKDGQETHGFSRNTITVNSSRFGFAFVTQTAERGFTRLGDLSDSERGLLVADIYRFTDPNAKPESVSPNDRNLFAKGTELRRQLLRFDAGLAKNVHFGYTEMSASDLRDQTDKNAGTQGFSRRFITLKTTIWDVSYLNRNADTKFGRIADLTDLERQTLALDIRRQFDPTAKPEQVTPHERDTAVNEAGLARTGLSLNTKLGKGGKLGQFGFGQISLTDKAATEWGGISRNQFAYTGKTLHFDFLNQSIESGFSRLANLNDFERQQFANERGLDRRRFALNWQEDKTTKIGFTSLQITGNASSVAAAEADAQKSGKDVAVAGQNAASGVQRDSLSVDTKGFTLLANRAETGKGFTRSGDLALSDTERNSISQEVGYRRFDVTSKFALGKWLSADVFQLVANNDSDPTNRLGRDNHKNALGFNPNKKTSLSFLSEGDVWTTGGKGTNFKTGSSRDFLQFKQEFGKGYLLTLAQDKNSVYAKDTVTGGAKVDSLQFQTPEALPTGMKFESRTTANNDGSNERLASINVHSKPTKTLKIGFTRTDIERDRDADETSDGVDIAWQVAPKLSLLGGVTNRDLTPKPKTDANGNAIASANPNDDKKGDYNTVSFGLQGEPAHNITLTAKFDEVHNVTENTRDTADFALSNSKPLSFGPISDLTITARYASLNDQRKLQNETMTGRATWKLWKNEFILDYGGKTEPSGVSTISRLYSITTDPNPKRPFRGSFYYKVRNLLDGTQVTIRRFTAEAKLAKNTQFAYTYGNLAEDEKLNLIPATTADVSLKHAFAPGRDFQFFYRLSDNTQTKIMTRSLGFSFEGKLDKWSRLSLGFSADGNHTASTLEATNHFRIAYERNINANQFFTLSTDYKSHLAGVPEEIQASMDFRLRF